MKRNYSGRNSPDLIRIYNLSDYTYEEYQLVGKVGKYILLRQSINLYISVLFVKHNEYYYLEPNENDLHEISNKLSRPVKPIESCYEAAPGLWIRIIQ